jgi:hypothetical protein
MSELIERADEVARQAQNAADAAALRADEARARRLACAARLAELRADRERIVGSPDAEARRDAAALAAARASRLTLDTFERAAKAHDHDAIAHDSAGDLAERLGDLTRARAHREAAAAARKAAALTRARSLR